ncbi:MAG: PilN domain-containing protein [bacterium]|nr:PilN domain-containing protein [bacterium]
MKIEINLSQHKYEKRSVIILFYSVIIALILSAVFYNYKLIYYYNDQLAGLNEKNADLNKKLETGRQIVNEKGLSEKDSSALLKKIDYVNLVIEKQAFSWTGLIYHLEEHTPDEISITEITPSFAENNIKIIGLAKTVDDIVKFVNNLQLSSYFKEVFLLEHSEVEIEKNQLIKFVITSKYIKE